MQHNKSQQHKRKTLAKNKAGFAWIQMMFGFFKIFFVAFIVFAILFVVRSHLNTSIDIVDAEIDLFTQQLLYAKGGVSYYDQELNRVYPLLLDEADFENPLALSARLEKTFNYKQPIMAAKLVLSKNDQTYEPVYYYKTWYERWEPLAVSRLIGSGAAIREDKTVDVLLKTTDAKIPAKLTITVVTPR